MLTQKVHTKIPWLAPGATQACSRRPSSRRHRPRCEEYTTLHCTTLHYTTLHYTILYYTILYYIIATRLRNVVDCLFQHRNYVCVLNPDSWTQNKRACKVLRIVDFNVEINSRESEVWASAVRDYAYRGSCSRFYQTRKSRGLSVKQVILIWVDLLIYLLKRTHNEKN